MSWHMADDLTGDRIADPTKSSVVTILLDNDPVAAFDVDPEHYTREALLLALGERLVDHDVESVPEASAPRRIVVGAGETVLVRHVDGDDVVREWLVGPGALDYAETVGITIDPDPSPAVPPARGEADAPAPDPAGEGRAPAAATNGHALSAQGDEVSPEPVVAPRSVRAAVEPVGDGVDGGEGNGLGPYGSDEAPVATPEREPDALTRAEELLEKNWTPRQVSDAVGLELAEVQDIQRTLRQRAKGKKK